MLILSLNLILLSDGFNGGKGVPREQASLATWGGKEDVHEESRAGENGDLEKKERILLCGVTEKGEKIRLLWVKVCSAWLLLPFDPDPQELFWDG